MLLSPPFVFAPLGSLSRKSSLFYPLYAIFPAQKYCACFCVVAHRPLRYVSFFNPRTSFYPIVGNNSASTEKACPNIVSSLFELHINETIQDMSLLLSNMFKINPSCCTQLYSISQTPQFSSPLGEIWVTVTGLPWTALL